MNNNEAEDLDMPILTPPADHQEIFLFKGVDQGPTISSDILNHGHSGNLNNLLIINQNKKIRPTCNPYFLILLTR